MLRKIFSVIVLVAMIFICGQNNSIEAKRAAHTWATVVNCREWISLYSEPSVYSERLAKIPLGTNLKIYYEGGPKNGFYFAYYEPINDYGWVSANYLNFD